MGKGIGQQFSDFPVSVPIALAQQLGVAPERVADDA